MEKDSNQQELETKELEIKEVKLEEVAGGTLILPPAIDEPIHPSV